MGESSPMPLPEPGEGDTVFPLLPVELIYWGLLVCIREVQDPHLRLCGLLKVILAISNILKFFVLASSAPLPIPCLTVVLGCDNLFWCCVRPDPLHSLHVMPQAQVMLNAVAKSNGSKIGSIKPEQVICWITLLKLCFLDEIFTNIFEMFRS